MEAVYNESTDEMCTISVNLPHNHCKHSLFVLALPTSRYTRTQENSSDFILSYPKLRDYLAVGGDTCVLNESLTSTMELQGICTDIALYTPYFRPSFRAKTCSRSSSPNNSRCEYPS